MEGGPAYQQRRSPGDEQIADLRSRIAVNPSAWLRPWTSGALIRANRCRYCREGQPVCETAVAEQIAILDPKTEANDINVRENGEKRS